MSIRTPLRFALATMWVDPESNTVRFGASDRTRILLAGIAPTSYLVASEREALVAAGDSDEALRFLVHGGICSATGMVAKPSWCPVVEQTLPEPSHPSDGWLEVGIRVDGTLWCCSIPLGRLPHLQTGLLRHGCQVRYITRIRVPEHA